MRCITQVAASMTEHAAMNLRVVLPGQMERFWNVFSFVRA